MFIYGVHTFSRAPVQARFEVDQRGLTQRTLEQCRELAARYSYLFDYWAIFKRNPTIVQHVANVSTPSPQSLVTLTKKFRSDHALASLSHVHESVFSTSKKF